MKLSYPAPHQLFIDLRGDTSRLTDLIVAATLWALAGQRTLALDLWTRAGQGMTWQDLTWLDSQVAIFFILALHFTYRLLFREVLVWCRLDRHWRQVILIRSRFWGWQSHTTLSWNCLQDLVLVVDSSDPDYWFVYLTLMERDRLKTLALGERSEDHTQRLEQVNEIRRFLGWSIFTLS